MSLISDPISGVLGVFFDRAAKSELAKRLTLILETSIGATVSFLVVCGGMLLTTAPGAVGKAIGGGMAAAGVAIFATVQVSDNARGLKIAFTQKVADDKLDNPTTTIERNK